MMTGYRIGAVAKLTGIATDTIRAWERRYGVVVPNRGENNSRYYTDAHVQKLLSVKRLVDAGQAIGSICQLSASELQDRTNGLLGIDRKVRTIESYNWLVFSVQRPGWLKDCVAAQANGIVRYCASLDELGEQFATNTFSFVLIDMPSLSEESERAIKKFLTHDIAEKSLIVYKFASRAQLRSLTKNGFRLLKGPLEPFALVNLLGSVTDTRTQHRYSDSQLSEFIKGSMLVSSNCPAYLSDLVIALDQFEHASRASIDQSNIDGQLMRSVQQLGVQARDLIERAFELSVDTRDREDASALPV